MEANGKMILKVVGILLIIGAVVSVIMGIITLCTGGLLLAGSQMPDVTAQAGVSQSQAEGMGVWVTIYAVIVTALGIIQLIGGIIGVKNCGDVEASQKCIVWGLVFLVIPIANIVFSLIAGVFSFVMLFGFVLPLLFLYGAYRNKQSAEV